MGTVVTFTQPARKRFEKIEKLANGCGGVEKFSHCIGAALQTENQTGKCVSQKRSFLNRTSE